MSQPPKEHRTYAEQVQTLQERGLIVDDAESAAQTLANTNYYRLSAYLHTYRLRKVDGDPAYDERLNEFVTGVRLEQVVALYEFDQRLRELLLAGLESFEICFRAVLAYHAGMRDPHIHLRPDLLSETFTKQPAVTDRERLSDYDKWLQKYWARSDDSKEAFVAWHAARYDNRLPIWAAVEIMEFGQVARLYRGLDLAERDTIARDLGLQARTLASWVAAFNGLRNTCAHHARVWNRTLVIAPAIPRRGSVPELDHIHDLDSRRQKRIYVPTVELAWFLRSRGLRPDWLGKIRAHFLSFPDDKVISLADMGFDDEWETLDVWMP
ncbi:abortive infection bacteriophage resistance protein [Microbacterium sp. AK009]|jgi:abortive infection bacteriophage resistance protein|uniref:Abi family protein n=1 Tax=Microbacterium sp. AK009 TaxID=2723068 RepID=UPI0015CA9305|nr:Abi family protein [Microbacterium sp. AK009]NYF16887.1 abortive infection bacteriophage resistance protein [Microbacterium sp. AK009]